MSFHVITQAPARLNRSELAVPGSAPQMFEKAAASDADVIFLDLEDAVAPDDKAQARKNIIKALNEIDWGKKTMSVRINGLDTHYMYRDVVDVVEQAGERLDLIMIPKVGTAADVYAVDMMVTQIEDAKGYKKRIGFEHIIETALGMQNVTEIAGRRSGMKAAALRGGGLCGLDPGADDDHRRGEPGLFGADRQAGGWQPRRPLGRHVALCAGADGGGGAGQWVAPGGRAVRRFLGPRRLSRGGQAPAVLGCEGKWAIHPSQIALANEVMSPSDAEVTRAKRILEAMAQAAAEGKGAVSLDGRLIDYASIRQAEVLVQKARQIAGG
jgi:malyl-CoA/(S)-citramalyl-CoA lyase